MKNLFRLVVISFAAALGAFTVMPATSASAGVVREFKTYGNLCLDVPGSNAYSGAPVQLYTCNGSAAQKWDFQSDGTIRAFGFCLDVAQSWSAANWIQLYQCNGTNAQKWYIHSYGASPDSLVVFDLLRSRVNDWWLDASPRQNGSTPFVRYWAGSTTGGFLFSSAGAPLLFPR